MRRPNRLEEKLTKLKDEVIQAEKDLALYNKNKKERRKNPYVPPAVTQELVDFLRQGYKYCGKMDLNCTGCDYSFNEIYLFCDLGKTSIDALQTLVKTPEPKDLIDLRENYKEKLLKVIHEYPDFQESKTLKLDITQINNIIPYNKPEKNRYRKFIKAIKDIGYTLNITRKLRKNEL